METRNRPLSPIGGSFGTGVGTFLTQAIDNCFLSDEEKKSTSEIMENSLKSAAVAMVTSVPTAIINLGVNIDQNNASSLMYNFTPEFGNMLSAFFGAVDDACTYIYFEENNK